MKTFCSTSDYSEIKLSFFLFFQCCQSHVAWSKPCKLARFVSVSSCTVNMLQIGTIFCTSSSNVQYLLSFILESNFVTLSQYSTQNPRGTSTQSHQEYSFHFISRICHLDSGFMLQMSSVSYSQRSSTTKTIRDSANHVFSGSWSNIIEETIAYVKKTIS